MHLLTLARRRKKLTAAMLCLTLLLAYVVTYGVFVGRGSVDWWKPQSAFRYSDDQRINRLAGRLFYPLYWIDNRTTGILWLDHEPMKSLSESPEGTRLLAANYAVPLSTGGDAGTAVATDRQLIRRAVFLSWMKHFTEGRDASQTLFFLVLEPGEDGDIAAVYKGFRVRSSDESVLDQDPLKDKKTGERGLGLEAEHVTIKGTSAEVYGTFFSSAYSMGGYSFRLQKTGNTWIVIEVKQLWIT